MDDEDDRQRRRFEALVHASPDFIAVAGVDGKVEFVNEAGRALIGLSPDVDVTLTTISDYLTEEGVRSSLEEQQPAVIRDGYWSGETTLKDWRDGSPIPVMVTSFVMRDPVSQEPVAMATIQHDLRDMRAAAAAAAAATSALRQGEERQRALLLHLSDLVLLVDEDLNLIYASPSAGRILGYEEGSRIGQPLLDLIHPAERESARQVLEAVRLGPGASPAMRVRVLSARGDAAYFEIRGNNLLHEPSVRGIIITARDVTDSFRAERSQNDVAQVLELIAAEAPVPLVLSSIAHWVERQIHGSRCAVTLTDVGVPHRVLRDGASPSLPDAYRQVLEGTAVGSLSSPAALAVQQARPVLVEDLLLDARWAPLHDLARSAGLRSCWSYPITSPASGAILGALVLYGQRAGLPDRGTEALSARASHLIGITVDRHRLLDRLAHQAHHDALTLLPNRLQLLELLTEALHPSAQRRGRPVVLFCDLDRLKVINDSLGHDVGDELLLTVATRLRRALGPEQMVARFGGDEFVVLSTDLGAPSAVAELAEQVLGVISEPVELEGRLITPAASIGLVVAAPGQTATEVLRDADIAMYRAKQRGGNSFEVFDDHMRQRAFDRLDLEGQIRHGIEDDQFRLFYQPLVDLRRDDRIIGFEALLRWQHPERGLLQPEAFLQLAEETGLIVPLGEWVLRTAVATGNRWQRELHVDPVTLTVNVAAQQLGSAPLVGLVSDGVRALAPWTLGVELTESTLMDDTSAVLRTLQGLSAVGGQISIDDFGTGFSSLSYLTRLPVQRLKIDRSFVADLQGTSRAATTVAAAIVSLAGNLGLSAVAEGIETPDQRRRLLEMGCEYGQGFLFSWPLPEDEALELLRGQLARA